MHTVVEISREIIARSGAMERIKINFIIRWPRRSFVPFHVEISIHLIL